MRPPTRGGTASRCEGRRRGSVPRRTDAGAEALPADMGHGPGQPLRPLGEQVRFFPHPETTPIRCLSRQRARLGRAAVGVARYPALRALRRPDLVVISEEQSDRFHPQLTAGCRSSEPSGKRAGAARLLATLRAPFLQRRVHHPAARGGFGLRALHDLIRSRKLTTGPLFHVADQTPRRTCKLIELAHARQWSTRRGG